jgi:uncharacterized protein involved in type VI secretion and phage assembly
MAPLNPNAPVFVPPARATVKDTPVEATTEADSAPAKASPAAEEEENVTPQELEELEAAEEWVRTMAFLDELEREHLIELALRNAPSWKLDLIHKRVGVAQMMNRKTQPAAARAGFW